MLSQRLAYCQILPGQSACQIFRSFGTRFTQRLLIAPTQNPIMPYTREQIRLMRENPNFERELFEKKQAAKAAAVQSLHFNHYANDLNPANFLDLIVEDSSQKGDLVYHQILSKETPPPLWIEHTRPVPNKSIAGTYGSIKGSAKKIKPVVKLILKKHLYDAMTEMETCPKKCSEKIFRALNMVRNHALGVGMNEHHLWVKGAEI